MDKKLSNYLGSYTAKLDAMLNEAQKKIDQHGVRFLHFVYWV